MPHNLLLALIFLVLLFIAVMLIKIEGYLSVINRLLAELREYLVPED